MLKTWPVAPRLDSASSAYEMSFSERMQLEFLLSMAAAWVGLISSRIWAIVPQYQIAKCGLPINN